MQHNDAYFFLLHFHCKMDTDRTNQCCTGLLLFILVHLYQMFSLHAPAYNFERSPTLINVGSCPSWMLVAGVIVNSWNIYNYDQYIKANCIWWCVSRYALKMFPEYSCHKWWQLISGLSTCLKLSKYISRNISCTTIVINVIIWWSHPLHAHVLLAAGFSWWHFENLVLNKFFFCYFDIRNEALDCFAAVYVYIFTSFSIYPYAWKSYSYLTYFHI